MGYYKTDYVMINTGYLVFSFAFIMLTLPMNGIIVSFGLHNAILMGSTLNFIGYVIRCFINSQFRYYVYGQILSAIGAVSYMNGLTKLA